MTHVMLDSQMRTRLPDLASPFEFCDETGQIVGRYVPINSVSPRLEPPFARDEIERRKKEKDCGYSTAEVLAHLENL